MSDQPQTTPQLPGHRNPPPPPVAPTKPTPAGTPLVSSLNYLRKKSIAAAYDPEDKTIIRTSHLDTLLNAYDERVQEINTLQNMQAEPITAVSMNSMASVELTDVGREIWAASAYGSINKPNADHQLTTELWCLMQVFGPHLFNGCDMPFAGTGIWLSPPQF